MSDRGHGLTWHNVSAAKTGMGRLTEFFFWQRSAFPAGSSCGTQRPSSL